MRVICEGKITKNVVKMRVGNIEAKTFENCRFWGETSFKDPQTAFNVDKNLEIIYNENIFSKEMRILYVESNCNLLRNLFKRA